MKDLQSINPYNNKIVASFRQHTDKNIDDKIYTLQSSFEKLKEKSFKERAIVLKRLSEILLEKKDFFAETITQEVGKPISQSISEIEKCAWVCKYYAKHSEDYLKPKEVKTDANKSFYHYQALGVILAIMPWNYPFWQFFRVAAPNLALGNTILLKHASSCSNSAMAIETIFKESFNTFSLVETILASSSRMADIISHPMIQGISLTGSTKAGKIVAAEAGKQLKKCVLELGGNNAIIVLKDANIEKHIDEIVWARFQNTGQSCIAGKRFLVEKDIYETFKKLFIKKVSEFHIENPMLKTTKIGPMASKKLAKELYTQLQKFLNQGDKLLIGGKQQDAHFTPTIIETEHFNNSSLREETFGPLATLCPIENIEEGIKVNNISSYGLGISIFTENSKKIFALNHFFNEGAVFINSMVKSDPRLPFGGIKESGFGRELSWQGLYEFANCKTLYVK